jgi:hypothetical protein
MVSSISNKLLPQDYEDIVSTSKSTVSMKSEIMKMSNIVSFTEKSSNDVNLIFIFYLINNLGLLLYI